MSKSPTSTGRPSGLESETAHLDRLENQALSEMQSGRERDAIRTWQRLLGLDPTHLQAWTVLGQLQFRLGNFVEAFTAFNRAAALDGSDPRHWTNIAFVCQRLGDDAGEEHALFKALSIEPRDLLALLLRGKLFERTDRHREAAAAYGAALAVAPPPDKLSPDLRPVVAQAAAYRQQHENAFAEHLDRFLQPVLAHTASADLDRFRLSIDILAGRKRRYESEPLLYWYPDLPRGEFFERSMFPWVQALEARTSDILAEFLALTSANDGFVPYIRYRTDQPLDQWADLNESERWSAFHLIKDGTPVAENAMRCPKTMAALSHVPAPVQAGRTPVAMYSLLQPRTHIPPHVGASNTRLVAHLPLVVPPGCRFRVGNSVREWKVGEVLVFDDTVEHEVWNDSDRPRAVLIFDIWHPALSPAEQRMVTALSEGLNAFGDRAGGYRG